MNEITFNQFNVKLEFCYNQLKNLLSEIEFEDIVVSTDKFNEIDKAFQNCKMLYDKYHEFISNSKVNLSDDEKILFNNILNIVNEYPR